MLLKRSLPFLLLQRHFLLPVEWLAVVGIFIYGAAILLGELPLITIDYRSYIGFLSYFLVPYSVSIIILAIRKEPAVVAMTVIRTYVMFLVLGYLCYAFKHWSHLFGNGYFDSLYLSMDQWLLPSISWLFEINSWLRLGVDEQQYLYVYQLSFWAILIATLWHSEKLFMVCTTALGLNLLLGGLSYSVMPALGPFIYWDASQWTELQHRYYENTSLFSESNGHQQGGAYTILILGAMPSLHASIGATFAYYFQRVHWGLGVLGWLIVLYYIVHASLTGYHYTVDLLVGLALALLCVLLAEVWSGSGTKRD